MADVAVRFRTAKDGARPVFSCGYLSKRLEGDVQTGDHAVGFGEEDAARHEAAVDGRVGRDVAVAHVFLERVTDDVAVQRRV
jgi:hypothetical protein